MSQLTEIIIKSGLVSPNALVEMQRWGLPTGDAEPPNELTADITAEKLCDLIDEAIQSEGYVLTRETDLEAIGQYLASMTPAQLHLMMEDGSLTKFAVQVGKNHGGEFIIPWRGDSITDLLTNGQTFLKVEKEKIFFASARDLFYGTTKTFVVCTPSVKEPDANPQ